MNKMTRLNILLYYPTSIHILCILCRECKGKEYTFTKTEQLREDNRISATCIWEYPTYRYIQLDDTCGTVFKITQW